MEGFTAFFGARLEPRSRLSSVAGTQRSIDVTSAYDNAAASKHSTSEATA
jgi:hypothetical protein